MFNFKSNNNVQKAVLTYNTEKQGFAKREVWTIPLFWRQTIVKKHSATINHSYRKK